MDEDDQTGRIDAKLRGRSDDFRIGMVSVAYHTVDGQAPHRVRQKLAVKFDLEGQGMPRIPDRHLHEDLKLYLLQRI